MKKNDKKTEIIETLNYQSIGGFVFRVIKNIKKFNWFGFSVVLLLCMAGALLNENVSNFYEWIALQIIFGIPFSLFFLIAGRKD